MLQYQPHTFDPWTMTFLISTISLAGSQHITDPYSATDLNLGAGIATPHIHPWLASQTGCFSYLGYVPI